MSKENIFDLSKIAAPSHDYEAEAPKEIDREMLLEGYEFVPQNDWKYIPYGSLVRYLRKDGNFRKGGVVQGVWPTTDKEGNNIIKIDISSAFGDKRWSVNSNTVEKVWVKRSQQQTAPTDISELKEDVESLKESIKQITIQIQKINNEQLLLLGLIKRLHKIK